MNKKIRLMIVLVFLATSLFFPTLVNSEQRVMTREEFDLWPDYPEYTVFNYFPSKGTNCTWYAHGRMMQLGYCKYALDSMRFNARTWAESASRGAEVSEFPQVGAIACWDGTTSFSGSLGHVAVVEKLYEDGSILVSDSSSSGEPYHTYVINPGDRKWPAAFIIVPRGPERSNLFSLGEIVKTTVPGLNFRLKGVNETPVLLPADTFALVHEHASNGIFASQPGSITSYHHWWYAEVNLDGEARYGWLAETYLESTGYEHNLPEPNPQYDSEPEKIDDLNYKPGDVNSDGIVNVQDITLTMQFVLNSAMLDQDQVIAADVNKDDRVDIRDVVLITQYALGLISSFDF